MQENVLKLWDEKAMCDTLRHIQEILLMLTKLKTIMNSTVMAEPDKETKSTMNILGITTSNVYTEIGRLTIDETKL